MNKKNIVTKENITKIADFLKDACDCFKNEGKGCFNFPLSKDLAEHPNLLRYLQGYDVGNHSP